MPSEGHVDAEEERLAKESAAEGSGRGRPRKASVQLEVPFHDIDSQRVVWHGHYFKYLEIARSALLRECGLDRPDLAYEGHTLVVVESSCRHSHPLRYRDRFRVDAWFKEIDSRIVVAYEIHNLDAGCRAARARTVLVTLDPEGKMLYRTPPWLLAPLRRMAPQEAASERPLAGEGSGGALPPEPMR